MIPPDDMLARLAGTDVIIAFVESYGRSSVDNPVYAATTRTALRAIEDDLASHGYAMRSAWLTSPTFGGQSWLAHSTLLSGLWIDTQASYTALLSSPRPSLLKLASNAGWRTVGVMPAVSRHWPEASYYGYDKVLAAADLGYKGLPFNWVSMPDQYTWSAFERLELGNQDRSPVFAEMALISSHAPWTPIPSLVPWTEVGDGTVFNMQARAGDSPETIWRDRHRVRDQFRQAIDYALRTIGGFAARQAGRKPLFIVLGDHQPAAFVSGTETNRDVPVHMIGDPAILAMLDGWNWQPGMVPNAAAPVWRMDMLRDRFVRALSGRKETVRHKDPSA
jgi:hypothetical protein